MEYQAAQRREKNSSDRISRLPESVLLHILCFLSQKKAVQTSVLSKSWRHLGPTRPVIHLREDCVNHHVRGIDGGVCENCLNGNKEAFISVLEKTFQRYHDHNLSMQKLRLELSKANSQSISVLEKWAPILFYPHKPAVATFHLSFDENDDPYTNLTAVVFKAESLRELHLARCTLNEDINSIEDNFMLKNLQKLSLSRVCISDEALEKVTSGCPLVKRLVLDHCYGFKTVNIIGNKNHCLDHFEISSSYGHSKEISIETDVPTLESICIVECWNWYSNMSNHFPQLKSLFLSGLNLPADCFYYFSCNFPCLQVLSLLDCYCYEEVNLSSRSIKRLIIQGSKGSFSNVAIEVPNILYFEISNIFWPTKLSLATTSSRVWKSHINMHYCVDDGLPNIVKLFGLVKALSQSQISLTLFEMVLNFKIEWDFNDHPVVVQHLCLIIKNQCFLDSLGHFLNILLRIFHPKYLEVKSSNGDKGATGFLWNKLIHERENMEYSWKQHLEKVSIEASDKKGIVWHHVEWTHLPECSKDQKIRFRLKWRD